MRAVIFEDDGYKNLYPLTYLRPSYAIKCGAFSILDTLKRELGDAYEVSLHCRGTMSDYMRETHEGVMINHFPAENTLFINGRFLLSKKIISGFAVPQNLNKILKHNGSVIAVYLAADKVNVISEKAGIRSNESILTAEDFEKTGAVNESMPEESFQNDVIEYKYPWDAFSYFKYLLERDIMWSVQQSASLLHNFDGVKIIANEDLVNINYGRAVNVYPNVVLDTKDGGVVIDDEAVIEPYVFIKGPAYIGKHAVVKAGSKIYGPCLIGDHSKVAGEISSSIFHSYVNKQHDGFVGNSYICPMVNLGADTVTSNLKNNYSSIKMDVDGEKVDTGTMFLGSIIGDQTKCGINTMLNTGSMIGIFANIFGGGFPSKRIGSFTWNEVGKEPQKYDITKALETAERVMSRRSLEVTTAYETLVRKLYEETVI
jgi:UDP-N-acetylglucosamine diphosphorylase / glucose-1-phosphate thymidylyltransferase / UDP-N-acetylgalactosamine diphosphorylase / glucosamine-1-phosphate N-acetyltransferase / galactosamine-1-phosphate N-acetyltransferase